MGTMETSVSPLIHMLSGAPVAAVLFYFLIRVLGRSEKREDSLLEAFKSNTTVMTEMRDTLRALSGAVENLQYKYLETPTQPGMRAVVQQPR